MSELQGLKDEIQNDPRRLGYARKSPGEIANLLNAKNRTGAWITTYRQVRKYSARNGLMSKLWDIARGTSVDFAALNSNHAIRSICIAFLEEPGDTEFDPEDSGIRAMLEAVEAAGLINSTQKDQIRSLGGSTVSRAQELFRVDSIHYDTVREALAL